MYVNGSGFTFLRGTDVAEVVACAGLDSAHEVDLTGVEDAAEQFFDAGIAVFQASDEWTVFYESNGYPDLFANTLIAQLSVVEAVIVWWNVNAKTEFSYWDAGSRVVTFESAVERRGTDPDRLLPAMQHVGLLAPDEDMSPARPLALAEQITGIHLGPDFLSRRLVAARYDGWDE